MARKNRDNKFLRLTGLWPSKKNDSLYSGKLRGEDVEKLQEKIEEADGGDLVFFLWENEKEGRKDPDFTLQVAVATDNGDYKKKRRDEEEEEDEKPRKRSRKDADDEEEEDSEEDDRPAKKSKKSKSDW